MKTILVCTLCSAVLLCGAQADPEGAPERDKTERKGPLHGRGKDGEGHGERERMFRHMDGNKDGKISREEFFAVALMDRIPEEKRDELYARLDRNQDGMISRREIEGMRRDQDDKRRREFRELDTDQSRGLSFEEFSKGKFFSKLPDEKRREIFKRMDTDGDGEITPGDRPAPPRRPRGED